MTRNKTKHHFLLEDVTYKAYRKNVKTNSLPKFQTLALYGASTLIE